MLIPTQTGYDTAAVKDRFDLTFGMRSTGATNVKDFVEATDCMLIIA